MAHSNTANNKRILKNTMMLYIRMFVLMAVNLYTSRVILQALGADDYGIYNVVGGFVAMFTIVSSTLSGACGRFLNVAIGEGNEEKLKQVFSTSLFIHIVLAGIIAVIIGAIGVWFVNCKMVLAAERLPAANWALLFSVITFGNNLITVPFNAAIIAHERMKTFAYVSVLEGVGQLAIAFLVMISPIDQLVFYAACLCLLQFVIRMIYRIYCHKHFAECRGRISFERAIVKELLSFASWNIIGTSAAILRTQGITMLVNLFFGPAVNASRALGSQVLKAINGFAANFMMAVRPQIMQSYAKGDIAYMSTLVYYSSKLSYFLIFFLSLPVLMCMEYFMQLWLVDVPEYAVIFSRLSLVFIMIESLSQSLKLAQMATGNIKYYQIIVGTIQILNIPFCYIWLYFGGTPVSVYVVAIILAIVSLMARLIIIRRTMQFDSWAFVNKVLFPVTFVTLLAVPVPLYMTIHMPSTLTSTVLICLACLFCSAVMILFVGCSKRERDFVFGKLTHYIHRKK